MRHRLVSRCDPNVLDFVTWSVMKGCRLFGKARVELHGLTAAEYIPEYDFVCLTPAEATHSVVTAMEDTTFPSLCTASNFGEVVPFWSDVHQGTFAFVCYMAAALLTGRPVGLERHLRLLSGGAKQDSPGCLTAAATPAFREWTSPVVQHVRSDTDTFREAFTHAFGLFRRHAVPLWSSASDRSALPYFADSSLAAGRGEILGLVPFVDLAAHSSTPNASAGFPDKEMLLWLQQERHLRHVPSGGCIVLQAVRDIRPGEPITVDKNASFNFDSEGFEAWFGHPWKEPHIPAAKENTTDATPTATPEDDWSSASLLDAMLEENNSS
eukprot:gene5394-3883_t